MIKRPIVSIVIPAYNEEHRIGACLESLCSQKSTVSFEVFVVDNGSSDKTTKVASSFRSRLPVTVLQEPRRGRGRARRTGFEKASGKVFFSTDADVILPPNWISSLLKYLDDHPKAVAVTGLPKITDCTPTQNQVFNTLIPHIISANYITLGHPGLSGFSFAVKASAYQKAGGFDPKTDAYEDLDLGQRVAKLGKIGLLRSPRVTFSGRRFQKGLLRGYMEYMTPYLQKFLLGQHDVLLSVVDEGSQPKSAKRSREVRAKHGVSARKDVHR